MAVTAPRFTVGAPVDGELSLREAFSQSLKQSIAEQRGDRITFMDWSLKVPEPKGPLRFDIFPFQREMYGPGYDDRQWVIKKSTQLGVTAWAVRWLIYHTDTRGMTGLYVFPTLSDVYDLADARIKPLIEGSRYLRARQLPDDPNNKGLKKIGLGFAYFRGSESKRKLDSVDADHLVLDEYDTLAQDNIPDAEMRLSGAMSKGLIRRLGVPSIPGWGISKSYEETDQRQWMVKCGCGEWQEIDFFKNVDQDRVMVVCRECRKPLDVGSGQWVATYPDRDIRGYHATRLIVPTIDIASIIKQSKKRDPAEKQVFFNKHLGIEYARAEGRLSREVIAAAQRSYEMVEGYQGPHVVTMGVDVASTRALNVRISKHMGDGEKIALLLKEVEDFNELENLMRRYDVRIAVIDHLPDGRMSRAFAERFPGQVFLCAYNTKPTPTNPDVIKVDEEMKFVTVRRTEAMDAVGEAIRSQRNLLPVELPEGYVEAMQAPVRVVTKDELGRRSVSYKSMGSDDWYHAEVYDVVAEEVWWFRQARDDQDRDEMTRLEDQLEFQRSTLADPDADMEYSPGGVGEDSYYEGGSHGGY